MCARQTTLTFHRLDFCAAIYTVLHPFLLIRERIAPLTYVSLPKLLFRHGGSNTKQQKEYKTQHKHTMKIEI